MCYVWDFWFILWRMRAHFKLIIFFYQIQEGSFARGDTDIDFFYLLCNCGLLETVKGQRQEKIRVSGFKEVSDQVSNLSTVRISWFPKQ